MTLELPVDGTPVQVAAMMYARAGLAPVPVYGVTGEQCGCGNGGCQAPGKHPVGGSWQKRASPDVDTTRELFRDHEGNIGIVVGAAHVVLDIDYYADGRAGLAELGEMPPTLTSESGSGQGEHRVFAYAPGQDPAEVTNRKIAPGVDVKTRAGQIVVAPSRHRSGGVYRWRDASPIALLPDALYERIRKRRVVPLRSTTPQGSTDLLARAEAYVRKLPSAVSGQRGHDATFSAARAVYGWVAKGLPESAGWSLLLDYNRRCDPPWSERELRHKWEEAQRADRIPVYEDRALPAGGGTPAPAAAIAPDIEPDWRSKMIWSRQKSGPDKPAKHYENAVVILRYHPEWKNKIMLDEHSQRVLVADPPWHESDAPSRIPSGAAEWTDADSARLSAWIRREWEKLDLSVADCDRAVTIAAESNTCHPFRDYLDGLAWDGTKRLSHWLTDYLGATNTRYADLVGTWWLIAAVARTYDPGCKADNVLILEGEQGIRKSTALRTLAGNRWFTDTPIDLSSKDAYLAIQGRVIVELAELDSLKRADADRAKTFFSSPVDHYRPPYGKRTIAVPRACVFAGTVNQSSYLKDDTGNRRYWPVRCERIDIAALAAARDQLWAEATALYRAGHRWYPDTPEEHALCVAEQAPRAEGDVWEDAITRYVANREETTTEEVMTSALKMEISRFDRGSQIRVGRTMATLGFARIRVRSGSTLRWVYRRVPISKNEKGTG